MPRTIQKPVRLASILLFGALILISAISFLHVKQVSTTPSPLPSDLSEEGLENATTSQEEELADDRIEAFAERELEKLEQPPPLSKAIEGWTSQEEEQIAAIRSESFLESLQGTATWMDNYFRIVHAQAVAGPECASSLHNIYLSRRWAKLVASLSSDASLLPQVLEQLQSDTTLLEKSMQHYGSLTDQNKTGAVQMSRAPDDKGPLLVPEIMYRINTEILLMAQAGYAPATQTILETVDLLGEDMNWSVAGFASDMILSSVDTGSLSGAQQEVIDDYTRWKGELPEGHAFKRYERIDLPAFDSAFRPGDRSVVVGASARKGGESISFVAAPPYAESPLIDPVTHELTGEWYSERDYRKSAKQLVDMLRRFNEAK